MTVWRRTFQAGVFLASLLLLAGASAPRARAADAEPLATTEELHKLFTDAQYQPMLLKMTRVLQLKGPAAKAYDRVDLELLRADALLELKQNSSALAAVADAVKATTEETDEKLAARARATGVLFKRMQVYAFTPKSGPKGQAPKAISLLDMALRKDAFTALLGDLRAETAAKAKTAKAGKTLPPIIDAVKGIADMRAVELTATGADAESQQIADDLASEAKALTGEAVATMQKKAQAIDTAANQTVVIPTGARVNSGTTAQPASRKKGLTYQDQKDLKEIVVNCGKIEAVAKDFAAVSKASAAGFKEVGDTAAATGKAAQDTLSADYTGMLKK